LPKEKPDKAGNSAVCRPGPAALYISHDGVLEPVGQSQILSYLQPLAREFPCGLLSFEKADKTTGHAFHATQKKLRQQGVAWSPFCYHRRPPVLAQGLDILRAGVALAAANLLGRIGLFHARSYPPALMALIGRIPQRRPLLFDMRGFWPEERISAGLWRAGGWLYRLVKGWERIFLRQADRIVVLTKAAKTTLAKRGIPRAKISVIPTCVDLAKFKLPRGKTLRRRAPWLCFSGNCQTWYLRDEMIRTAARLMEVFPGARLQILTWENPDSLRADLASLGIPPGRTRVLAASFGQMPRLLARADLGIFFIRRDPAAPGRAAIKLAEFLACGVPVLINAGIGDSDRIVKGTQTGLVLPDTTPAELEKNIPALRRLLRDRKTPRRCRIAAKKHFDLQNGVRSYRRLYRELLVPVRGSPRPLPVRSFRSLCLPATAGGTLGKVWKTLWPRRNKTVKSLSATTTPRTKPRIISAKWPRGTRKSG